MSARLAINLNEKAIRVGKSRKGMNLVSGEGGVSTPPLYDVNLMVDGLPAGATFSRNTVRMRRDNLGEWLQVAVNQPRLHHDIYGTPLGMLFERSFNDKAVLGVNPTVAPTDTSGSFAATPVAVSLVNSNLKLEGSGWQNRITSCLLVTNATGADIINAFKNTVGTLNKFSLVMLTLDTGAGANLSGMKLSGGGQTLLTAADTVQLLELEGQTPTTISRIMQSITKPGKAQYIYFIMMSETPYAPTPILHPTDNVAVTVDNEWASWPLAGTPFNSTEIPVAFEWFHRWPFSVDNEPIFALAKASSPTTDYCGLFGMADMSMKAEMKIGGSTIFSSTFAAPTRNTVCRAAMRLKSGAFMAAVNGVGGSVSASAADFSGLDTIFLNKLSSANSNMMGRRVQMQAVSTTDNQVVAVSVPSIEGFY